jgi:hypothetical protein
MKTLCLATLLLVGYSSLAQIKSFDDLRGIDSFQEFQRVMIENGYLRHSSDEERIFYDLSPYHETNYFLKEGGYFSVGDWFFVERDLENLREYDKCSFDKIFEEVQNACSFLKVKKNLVYGDIATYACEGVKYQGIIGFNFMRDTLFVENMVDIGLIGRIFHLQDEYYK